MESGVPQIPVFDVRVGDEELEAVAATLRSGWLSAGPQTEAFFPGLDDQQIELVVEALEPALLQ